MLFKHIGLVSSVVKCLKSFVFVETIFFMEIVVFLNLFLFLLGSWYEILYEYIMYYFPILLTLSRAVLLCFLHRAQMPIFYGLFQITIYLFYTLLYGSCSITIIFRVSVRKSIRFSNFLPLNVASPYFTQKISVSSDWELTIFIGDKISDIKFIPVPKPKAACSWKFAHELIFFYEYS